MIQDIVAKVAPSGFLADYIKYCSDEKKGITDAPREFALGAGLTALSTACGSRVVYPGFGGRQAWPNLYTLLIAPSGLYRKSTSVGIAEDLIRAANPDYIFKGTETRESFLSVLKERPNVMYVISEFAAVLGIWSRDYAVGTKEMVTDLYDNHEEYIRQTLKAGKQIVQRPAVNILAASTIDWLRERLTEGDLKGGLMGRFLLIPGKRKGKDRGLVPVGDAALRQSMLFFIKKLIAQPTATVDMSNLIESFNRWVADTEREVERHPNPDMVGFQSRIGAHCLKLAVLLCVSRNGASSHYLMTSEDLAKAQILAKWLLHEAEVLAETGFVKSKFEVQVQKLLGLCKTNGGISRSDALRLLHTNVGDFSKIVDAATQRGEIKTEQRNTATKKTMVYTYVPPAPETTPEPVTPGTEAKLEPEKDAAKN